jgi:hypothetical protein
MKTLQLMASKVIFSSLLLLFYCHANSQVTITGPTCVTADIQYQYIVHGAWTAGTTSSICIAGGKFGGTDSTCSSGGPVSVINVTWDSAYDQGQITLQSSAGNFNISVSIAKRLSGGEVEASSKQLVIASGAVPANINCSVASGGHCSPSFSYQWQESADGVTWTDVQGANNSYLHFTTSFTQDRLYRRKVTETASTSVSYSDQAAVIIQE